MLEPCADLSPAQRTQPGEESSLPSECVELSHGTDERQLDDVLGGLVVIPKAETGEPVESREVVGEKCLARRLITGQNAAGQFQVAHRLQGGLSIRTVT